MPRIRPIHPGQWRDENFVECSMPARLLALGLRNLADDYGVFAWKPMTIKMEIFPADNLDLSSLLRELEQTNQVRRYEVNGKSYGAIRNFCRWNRAQKPSRSYPRLPWVPAYCGEEGAEQPTDDMPQELPPVPADDGRYDTGIVPVQYHPENAPAEVLGIRSKVLDSPPTPSGGEQTAPEGPQASPAGASVPDEPLALKRTKPSKRDDPALDPNFTEWWQAYPRKVAKPDAAAKYRRAILSGARPDDLMDGLVRAKREWDKDDRPDRVRFIPHPAKWLNHSRWQDGQSPTAQPEPGESCGKPDPVRIRRVSVGATMAQADNRLANLQRNFGTDAIADIVEQLGNEGDGMDPHSLFLAVERMCLSRTMIQGEPS